MLKYWGACSTFLKFTLFCWHNKGLLRTNFKRLDCALQKKKIHNTISKHINQSENLEIKDWVHKALCPIYEKCQKLLLMTLEKVCAFSVALVLFPFVSKRFHSALEKLTCQEREKKRWVEFNQKIIKIICGASAQPKLYLFSWHFFPKGPMCKLMHTEAGLNYTLVIYNMQGFMWQNFYSLVQ